MDVSVVPQGAESPTVPTDTAYAPKVVCENLVQQCRWRSIQFYIEVPELADPGLYDLEVSFTDPDGNEVTDYVMEEALNVIKVEFVDKDDNPLDLLLILDGDDE